MNFPRSGNTPRLVYYRTRNYAKISEFSTSGNTLQPVYDHMRMYRKISEFSQSGYTPRLVYYRMRHYTKKSEFPHKRKYTKSSENPRAETQEDLWKTHYEDLHIIVCISTCGNTRGNVYFHMREYTRKRVLPHAVIHQILLIFIPGTGVHISIKLTDFTSSSFDPLLSPVFCPSFSKSTTPPPLLSAASHFTSSFSYLTC